jgi:hypothetical protein
LNTNENRCSRLPTALIWLLVYQWMLVVAAAAMACNVAIMGFVLKLELMDRLLGWLEFLVLAGWGTAMGFASVGMARRRPRAFLVGMICHLLLEIPGLVGVVGFTILWLQTSRSDSGAWVWDPFFLIFALMWLPFVLISAWAFFYLRRLRGASEKAEG